MIVKFTVDDVDYSYNADTLLLPEARYVKKHFGLTVGEFITGTMQLDADALVAITFLARRRNGEHVVPEDLESLDLIPLITSLTIDHGTPGDEAGEASGEDTAATADEPEAASDVDVEAPQVATPDLAVPAAADDEDVKAPTADAA